MAPFPAPPRQTVHEVFPHTAFLWEVRDRSPSLLKRSRRLPVFLACAIHLSRPLSENTHSRSPSLTRSYVVFELERYYGSIRLPHRRPLDFGITLYQGSPPRPNVEG